MGVVNNTTLFDNSTTLFSDRTTPEVAVRTVSREYNRSIFLVEAADLHEKAVD
jgi:hypothetical protein